MSVGATVMLYGKVPATVLGVSSNGKNVHVLRDDGRATWTSARNVSER